MEKALRSNPLFQSLSKEHLALVAALSEKELYPAGTILLKEGETSLQFYLIVKGEVEILKRSEDGNELRIRKLQTGDLIGELAFIEEKPRSATVRTLVETEVIRIDGATIKRDPSYIEVYAALAVEIGKSLSERLRYTNSVTVKAMQSELTLARSQVAVSYVIMSIIFLMTLYIVSLGVVMGFKEYLPSPTPISISFIFLYTIVLVFALKRGGYPFSRYGLTLENWRYSLGESMIYTTAICALIVLAKWLVTHFIPEFHSVPLFQPMVRLKTNTMLGQWVYLLFPLAYAIFAPLQEFIVRGALQSSFQMFFARGEKAHPWTSIFFSNLLFASAHVYISLIFAAVAFGSGLFWGWMYNRQRTLLGVSLSHVIIGVWAVFIVGFKVLA